MTSSERQAHPLIFILLSGLMIIASLLVILKSSQLDLHQAWEGRWVALVAVLATIAVLLWEGDNEALESGSGFIPIIMGALAFGPSAAFLIALVSGIPLFFVSPARSIRRIATRIMAGVAVAIAFQELSPQSIKDFVLDGFLCALIYQVLQLLMTAALINVEFGGDLKTRLRELWPHFGLGLLIFGPMAVAYAYLLPKAPQAMLLATFAVAASHQLLSHLRRSRDFERLLSTMSAEIPGSLLAALDAADAYTAQHSAAVASYAYDLAICQGYTKQKARQIHAAALLHDVGKIGVPDSVLTKPGRLDENEWLLMQKHPELGANMVKRLPGFGVLEPGIRHHHERVDGFGYPEGKAGVDIPMEAQIIAVTDTYSAITTSRTYREGRDPSYGISELRKDAELGKLNPQLVETFISHIETQPLSYQLGTHTNLGEEVSKVSGWLDFSQKSLLNL